MTHDLQVGIVEKFFENYQEKKVWSCKRGGLGFGISGGEKPVEKKK